MAERELVDRHNLQPVHVGLKVSVAIQCLWLCSNQQFLEGPMLWRQVGPNTFTMDFQAPMSVMQAFAVCLSAFDHKLACE